MRFRIEQNFPAPLDQVEQALVDPAFLRELRQLPKLGQPELLDQVVDGHLVHQQVRYRFVGELNPTARRVLDGSRLSWVEESTLDRRTHHTRWRIVPDHYRHLLRCAGTFQLQPAGEAATQRVAEAEINVSVPLVAGKVEAAIVSGLREHAQLEQNVLVDWLAGRPSSA